MRGLRLFAVLAVVAAIGVVVATYFIPGQSAAAGSINTLGTQGVAIRGYDPVAYFTEGAPKQGKSEFTAEHEGARWQFASAENKALFEADPAKYTPAYGGFCAYGVAQGYLVKIEPDAWSIRDGRLYLNYDQSVQAQWSEKPAEYIAQADDKWPGLIAK
ncbi:MAG: YHS domain-containing (seleno)protein [Rhodomicrobiaceae bacterium]